MASVGQLKLKIKEQNQASLQNVDAKHLTLHRVTTDLEREARRNELNRLSEHSQRVHAPRQRHRSFIGKYLRKPGKMYNILVRIPVGVL